MKPELFAFADRQSKGRRPTGRSAEQLCYASYGRKRGLVLGYLFSWVVNAFYVFVGLNCSCRFDPQPHFHPWLHGEADTVPLTQLPPWTA